MVVAAHRMPNIPELFDRMIATAALVDNAELITRDSVLEGLELVKTIW